MPHPGIETGDPAPEFALEDADGRVVRLADLAGKWVVVYFYPRADTPGCTTEACEFTSAMDAFRRMGAEVVGISPDRPPALAKFRAKHGLAVRLLADPEKTALAAYGAWGEKKMYGKTVTGVRRSTVLVGPDGRVVHRWPNVRAAGHAAAVQARLEAARAGR